MPPEELATSRDRALRIQLDLHAITEEIDDVLREVVTPKRRGSAPQDLHDPGLATAQMKPICACPGEREHLQSKSEIRNCRSRNQSTRASPQHITARDRATRWSAARHLDRRRSDI